MVGERIRLLDDWQKLCDIDIILSRHSISRESENDIFTLVVTSRFPFTYLAFPRSLSGERAHFPSKVTKAQVFRFRLPYLEEACGVDGDPEKRGKSYEQIRAGGETAPHLRGLLATERCV